MSFQNVAAAPTLVTPPKKVAFDVLAIVGASLGALVMALVTLISFITAPLGTVLAVVLAVVPLSVLFLFYRWLDSYEPEPFKMLLLAFFWGACGATGVSLIVNSLFGLFLPAAATATLVAPVVEESMKGIFLFGLLYWRRGDLDGIVDALVYAGVIAGGFAFVENILYFTNAWVGVGIEGEGAALEGPAGLSAVFMMRGVISPFAHPIFSAAMAIGVGVAVLSRSRAVMVVAPFLGWLTAVALHAFWNGTAMLGAPGLWLVLFGAFQIPLFVSYVVYCVHQRRKLSRQLGWALTDAARRGFIPQSDLYWIVEEQGRRQARAYVNQVQGPAGLSLLKTYQEKAVRLGFLHYKVLTGTAPQDYFYRGHNLMQEIRYYRPQLAIPASQR